MTKKTGTGSGDLEGTTSEWTELRTVLVEMQTANTASIRQLGDTVGTLAARIEALTTALTARLDPQAQPVAQGQPQHPLHLQPPPLHRPHQQQIHPPQQHHPRAPPQHQQQQHLHQRHNIPAEEEADLHRRVYFEDLHQRHNYDDRWEKSFRVDIPEFHGGLRGDELIDWLVSVEEIMEFKQVPLDRRVPLVAMRFRGHAATWWKQLKLTRSRTGKAPIQSCKTPTSNVSTAQLRENNVYEASKFAARKS